jgi:hypothetical protein
MTDNIKNFCGLWWITQVASGSGLLAPGYQLAIGTGESGATPPFLTPEGDVCAGFAIRQPTGEGSFATVLSSDDGQNQELALMLVDGVLRWSGSYDGKPLAIYVSLCERTTVRGETYLFLYGSTVSGDPEQVGVWGAEGNPPAP